MFFVKKKSKESVKFNENSSNYKEKFNSYISHVNSGNDKAVVAMYLKNIVVEYLNYSEAIQSLENQSLRRENSFLELIYDKLNCYVSEKHEIYLFENIHEDDVQYYKDYKICDNKPIRVGINNLSILVNPWNRDRVISNLIEIDENNIFDGMAYSYNVQNHYLYPMDLVVCNGGNHSQFAARHKNQGSTIIKEIHDYSNLYSKIYFDGENFIQKEDKSIVPLEYNQELIFYSGIIFELGRYLFSNDYYGLDIVKTLLKSKC